MLQYCPLECRQVDNFLAARQGIVEERLDPVSASTLRDSVAHALRQAIIEGAWPSNARLHEVQIADQLGVSRAPLREALIQLQGEGLVRSEPNRGTYVAELTAHDVEEIQSLRVVLECFALRRAGARLMGTGMAELERIMTELAAAARAGDALQVLEKDLALHHQICALSQHKHLLDVWTRLARQVRRYMILNLKAVQERWGTLEETVDGHLRILEALRDGDLAGAEEALRQHLIESAETMIHASAAKGIRETTSGGTATWPGHARKSPERRQDQDGNTAKDVGQGGVMPSMDKGGRT
jgi:DNA-binding GntR family transcriptional regulator